MDPRFKLIVDAPEVTEVSGTLHRAIAPHAVLELMRARRVSGHLIHRGSMVGLVTKLKVGLEKPRTAFRAGDVAMNPADGSIWFTLDDSTSPMPMIPLGVIDEGLDALSKAPRGARAIVIVEVLS